MNNKKIIQIKTDEEDIPRYISLSISLALTKFVSKYEKITERFDESIKNKNATQILATMVELTNLFQTTTDKMSDVTPLVQLLNSKTKVLEDLSDLKEDGLGVGSRSEQSSGFSSDHLDE